MEANALLSSCSPLLGSKQQRIWCGQATVPSRCTLVNQVHGHIPWARKHLCAHMVISASSTVPSGSQNETAPPPTQI